LINVTCCTNVYDTYLMKSHERKTNTLFSGKSCSMLSFRLTYNVYSFPVAVAASGTDTLNRQFPVAAQQMSSTGSYFCLGCWNSIWNVIPSGKPACRSTLGL